MKWIKKIFLILSIIIFCQTANAGGAIKEAGDIGQFLLPAAALSSTLYYQDGTGALEFSEAFLTSMATVYILKPLVHRTRPNGGTDSFPSGHTTSAFAGAAFMQMRYGWQLGIPAYIAASFVGYSRIQAKEHWPTDVLAGAAIGIGSNLIFTKKYKNLVICPYMGPHNATGITVAKIF